MTSHRCRWVAIVAIVTLLHAFLASTPFDRTVLGLVAVLVVLLPASPRSMAAALLLTLLITTPAVDTWRQLVWSSRRTFEDRERVTTAIRSAGSGLEVLPAAALEIHRLLRARGLDTYRLSATLGGADQNVYQRIVEGSWPARLETASPHRFRHVGELPDGGCNPVDQMQVIALDHCR